MTEEIAKLTSFWVIKSLAIEKLSKLIKTHLPTYSTVYSEDKNNITIQPSHIKALTLNGKRNNDVFENCNHEPSDVLLDNSFSMFVWLSDVITPESPDTLVPPILVVPLVEF